MNKKYKAYKNQTAPRAQHVETRHVTIEHTGKDIKKKIVFTHILAIVGLLMVFNATSTHDTVMTQTGGMLWLMGTVWWLWLKIEIWWKHG